MNPKSVACVVANFTTDDAIKLLNWFCDVGASVKIASVSRNNSPRRCQYILRHLIDRISRRICAFVDEAKQKSLRRWQTKNPDFKTIFFHFIKSFRSGPPRHALFETWRRALVFVKNLNL